MSRKRVLRTQEFALGWIIVVSFFLPLSSKGQVPDPAPAGSRIGCNQESSLSFLKDVEKELGATYGSFRADGEARLAAIYFPTNRGEAFRLWRDAFFSVNGLRSRTIGVVSSRDPDRSKESNSSSTAQLAAYIRATEATPASVEARVIRDLLRFDRKQKAIEYFALIAKQDTPTPADGLVTQPVLIQKDFELPTVLMGIPLALWKADTDREQSYEYFRQIVAKFDTFPYLAAESFMRLKPAPVGHAHRVAEVLLRHFDGQDLDARNMAATRVTLEQFTRLLTAFEVVDANDGARLAIAKLKRLKTAGWSPNLHFFQQGLCGHLTEGSIDKAEFCGAQEVASNQELDSAPLMPPEVKKLMAALKTRDEALSQAGSDLSKAESIAAGIDEPLVRADLLADLAASAWKEKKNEADAHRVFKKAVETLRAAKVDRKSEYLQSVLHLAMLASRHSKTDFSDILQLGLVVMGKDSLMPEADFEELAYIHNGVSLLGLWAQVDRENALSRIKGIPDQKIRVLALLAAAEAGSLGTSQKREQELTQKDNEIQHSCTSAVPHHGANESDE